MAVINTLALLKTHWAAGGTHTIEPNTDGGSGGVYTLDANVTAGSSLTILMASALGDIVIDMNNARNLYLDGYAFDIRGYNVSNRIVFRRGQAHTMNLRATSAGMTGRFDFCEFNDAAGTQGVSLDGALAGNVDVTFNYCSGSGNPQDAYGMGADAVGGSYTATMTFNHCHAEDQTDSDYADGWTAHAINQTLYINDCTCTNCTNAVRIIKSAGGTAAGPAVYVDGLEVTDCKRLFGSITSTAPSTIELKRCDFSAPKAGTHRIAIPNGSLLVEDCYIEDNGSGDYGLEIGASVTNFRVYNTVLAHFDKAGLSCAMVIDSAVDIKNCTFDDNQVNVLVSVTGNKCRNTIFMNSLNATYGSWFSTGGDRYLNATDTGYNIFYNNAKNFYRAGDVLKATDLTVNPGLAADYTVSSTASGCYGVGYATWATTEDIIGNTRKSPPDIGAYEYKSAASAVSKILLAHGGR